ncbi:HlyD family efflux transporter periplasmic adaptor subunit [Bacillus sp. Marseille-P3661]|uniref:HlyD family efflux transporter periplasmic adaptor subunit n=1 Tax=Bacillus sp. Marseille-P3661 TaxID=1936234 RepID=UPI000C8433B1|nr:HlyD family secretion protein [Bacillus sp. Marseille-P3661]
MEKLLLWLSRRLLYLLGSAFIILMIWSYFYHVPQFVQARCLIVSDGKLTPILSNASGFIIQTNKQSGKLVEKNEVLFEIGNGDEEKARIFSPASGYFKESAELNSAKGIARINSNDLIGYIIEPSPLLFEAWIESNQIDSIRKGMKTFIKLDSYPFQKYGLIEAEILYIADIPSTEDETPLYQIKLMPKTIPQELQQRFKPGLEGVLQIVKEEKRLITYILPFIK